MKISVVAVYKTDNIHSYGSRDLIGVAGSKALAIALCQKQATKEGVAIDEEQIWNLRNLGQTQGYCRAGVGEFHMETIPLDTLI